MKIQLKNIVTEVPDNAVRIDELSHLERGDKILMVWDNPKFPGGIERNSRTLSVVYSYSSDRNCLVFQSPDHRYGLDWIEKCNDLNAHDCTSGVIFQKNLENKNFPHVIFKL